MAIESVNPATGQRMQAFQPLTDAEVSDRIARAADAFADWRRRPTAERARVVGRAGEILAAEKTELGRLMTREMGKRLSDAEQEADKCASGCRYYAENAEAFLRPEPVAGSDEAVHFQPLGVLLAVMPWNFPFWQVIRFAAPALVAGNVALLKHASSVPGCALALEDLFRRAGAPEGVFQTLLIGSDRVGHVLADPRVVAASLTGSEGAGRAIASAAGRLLKKTVLELGGSDPFLVLPSADIDAAAATAVKARLVNNGQSCIAAKRFIVVEAVYDRFASRFVAAMEALRVGDPMAPSTDVGPLATAAILETVDDQVRRSVTVGARVLTGGRRIPGPGNYYQPTVLADVPASAPVYSEEVFGPVASLFQVRDTQQAVAMANDTTFGLGAAVWTRDRAEAERVARDLEAGMVFINEMVVSDARFPFGGVKRSGYGRELGLYGMREFVNVKTVRMTGLA
jgi:succinate-semialdehyde dehydrogenase / glutarate-semialdehyde dehydrogenase